MQRAGIVSGDRAVSGGAREHDAVVSSYETVDRDDPGPEEQPRGPAIYLHRVAVRIEIDSRGRRGYLDAAGRRPTGHLERRPCGVTRHRARRDAHGARVIRGDWAVCRGARERDRVTPCGETHEPGRAAHGERLGG